MSLEPATRPNCLKAQSAMEYLMTYGWAILIVAIVLGVFFSLGLFSSTAFLSTGCIAQPGYVCTNPLLIHGRNFTVTVIQNTGAQWVAANIIFVETGSSTPTYPIPSPSNSGCVAQAGTNGNLASGVATSLSFNGAYYNTGCFGWGTVNVPKGTSVGSVVTGTLWALYNTKSANNITAEVGTVTLRAV